MVAKLKKHIVDRSSVSQSMLRNQYTRRIFNAESEFVQCARFEFHVIIYANLLPWHFFCSPLFRSTIHIHSHTDAPKSYVRAHACRWFTRASTYNAHKQIRLSFRHLLLDMTTHNYASVLSWLWLSAVILCSLSLSALGSSNKCERESEEQNCYIKLYDCIWSSLVWQLCVVRSDLFFSFRGTLRNLCVDIKPLRI